MPRWPDFTCQRPEWWAWWIQHSSNVYQTFFIKWSQTRQKKLHVAKNGLRLQNKATMKRYITTSTKLKNPNCNLLLSSTQIFLPPGKALKTILLSWQTTCMHPCSSENEMSLARQEILLGWLDSTFFQPCSNKQFSSIYRNNKTKINKSRVFLTFVNKNATASWGSIQWIKAP